MQPKNKRSAAARDFSRDAGSLFAVSLILALFIWTLCWVPIAVIAILDPERTQQALRDDWWARLGLSIGPTLAAGNDPLIPTLVTVLLALCIVEVWKIAPSELFGAATLATLIVSAWAFLSLTSLASAILDPSIESVTFGQSLSGGLLAVIAIGVCSWARHISPVGNASQIRFFRKSVKTNLERLATLEAKPVIEVKRPRLLLFVWALPALAPLPLSFTISSMGMANVLGLANFGFLAGLCALLGLFAYWAALDNSGIPKVDLVNRLVYVVTFFISTFVGVVIGLLILLIAIPTVKWYGIVLLALPVWVVWTRIAKDTAFKRSVLQMLRARLSRSIEVDQRRLHDAEARLEAADQGAVMRLASGEEPPRADS